MKPFVKNYFIQSRTDPEKKWKVIHFLLSNRVMCECPKAEWGRIKPGRYKPCYHEKEVLSLLANTKK